MPGPITYTWKLVTYFITLPLRFFGLSGFRLSLGIWFRLTKDCLTKSPNPAPTGSNVKRYVYSPLQRGEIRLLELLPGCHAAPLEVRLFHAELDKVEGQYEAVSYVWHSPGEDWWPPQWDLTIDGQYHCAIFSNLEHVLRTVRSESETRILWIDYLCINQQDLKERSDQVALMPTIFARSKAVLACLGAPSSNSVVGMEILSYLASDMPFNENSPWNRLDAVQVRAGLGDILARQYFERIWVVQEAALGQKVEMFIGKTSISWTADLSAVRFLYRIKLVEMSPAWVTRFQDIDFRPLRELLEQSVNFFARGCYVPEVFSLLDGVHAMRHRRSTDPRDKIYAMLGLASRGKAEILVPCYEFSWEQAYGDFYYRVEEGFSRHEVAGWRYYSSPT